MYVAVETSYLEYRRSSEFQVSRVRIVSYNSRIFRRSIDQFARTFRKYKSFTSDKTSLLPVCTSIFLNTKTLLHTIPKLQPNAINRTKFYIPEAKHARNWPSVLPGATGFLGKILLEKLLHSCPDIGTIYVLIRPKKGKNPEERINALFDDPVFGVLRSDYPDSTRKIVGLTGDIAKERLGLSAEDHARLTNEVSVIFHLAATVRLNEKLGTAIAMNVNSAKYVVDIAKECKKLKAGVHVSTACSHSIRESIGEKLYPPPLSYEEISKLNQNAGVNEKSEDELKCMEKSLLEKWPNTYTFTKAVAEGVVAEFAGDLPFGIFRPSMVINSYEEPVPGLVGAPTGVPAIVCSLAFEIMKDAKTDFDLVADFVPADYVCNALISSAWEIGITQRRQDQDIPVYNYVSGNRNPITWPALFDRLADFGCLYPINSTVYYPSGIRMKSNFIFTILHFFLHTVPALLIGSIGELFPWNSGLYKIASKVRNSLPMVRYFTNHQWEFEENRFPNLWNQMGLLDKKLFPFNIQNVDWDKESMEMVRGLRKYLLHEPDENIKQARRKHFYLFLVHVMLCAVLIFSILWLIWILFDGLSYIVGM